MTSSGEGPRDKIAPRWKYERRVYAQMQTDKRIQQQDFNAPINHWDAWLIYESQHRDMIHYPLPVTLFTANQCMSIQQPFIDAILPKLGINRKP